MMQYHQILANNRKNDQPEATTMNELRVDDIVMDQSGRLRLPQHASDFPSKLTSRSSTELTRHITPTRNGHQMFVHDGIDLEIP